VGTLREKIGDKSIHLCVDMQQLFASDGPWATPWLERILPTIISLAEHQPHRTMFTRFIPARSAESAPGTWAAYYRKWRSVTLEEADPNWLDLMPAFDRFVPPAAVFDRSTYSAFADGRLHRWLHDRDINTLIVSGAETDVCVLATVLAAVDLGYRTVVVRDALASSSDETHDALLKLYDRRFDVQVELADIGELVTAWTPDL
jgi:nicotinamidase-related amidase